MRIRKMENGQSTSDVSENFTLPKSTACLIRRNECKIHTNQCVEYRSSFLEQIVLLSRHCLAMNLIQIPSSVLKRSLRA